jgi:hypothetical protein
MSSVVLRPPFVLARVLGHEWLPVLISVLDAQQREPRGQLVDVVVGRATAGTREQQGQARLGAPATRSAPRSGA